MAQPNNKPNDKPKYYSLKGNIYVAYVNSKKIHFIFPTLSAYMVVKESSGIWQSSISNREKIKKAEFNDKVIELINRCEERLIEKDFKGTIYQDVSDIATIEILMESIKKSILELKKLLKLK